MQGSVKNIEDNNFITCNVKDKKNNFSLLKEFKTLAPCKIN